MSEDNVKRLWSEYNSALLKGTRTKSSDEFDRSKMAMGVLDLPADAVKIVESAERTEFRSELASPGYNTFTFSSEIENTIRKGSYFRSVSGTLADLLTTCVAQLRTSVAELLGTPWRICNVRVWTTPPATPHELMYKKHTDGYPTGLFKLMIYFTPMNRAHGGLMMNEKLLEGPGGSWILFYNSILMHAGVPGLTELRASAEITLARAREFDLALHQPGLNSHYPLAP